MSTNFLNFLATAKVEEVATKRKGGAMAKQRNPSPTLLAIRVWKDGSCYPSQALVARFDLEYRVAAKTKEIKIADVTTYEKLGNGFDVIDSRYWNAYKAEAHMLFIAPVPKSEPKVDLFQSCKLDDKGQPLVKVMDQGTATYGKETLLPAIEAIYGIKLDDDTEYVDMVVFDALPVEGKMLNITQQFSKPITHIPKTISRGKNKDQQDYIRRENLPIWGFAPLSVIGATAALGADGNAASLPEDGMKDSKAMAPKLEAVGV